MTSCVKKVRYIFDIVLLLKGNIDWKTLSIEPNQKSLLVKSHKIEDIADIPSLQFAVAITTREVTGPMVWEEYRYLNANAGMVFC